MSESATTVSDISTMGCQRDLPRADVRRNNGVQPDGSWVNRNRQFMENDPNLCTAFALLAPSYCDDKPKGK